MLAVACLADDAPLHRLVPLGSETIALRPANQLLTIFATQQCDECADLVLAGDGSKRTVRDLRGQAVPTYPRMFFRVTATARIQIQDAHPIDYPTRTAAQDFMSGLHFRLLVFHGLEVRELKPAAADLIGVPAAIPYNERIYLLAFDLKEVPIDRRMSLEVFDAQGNRVTKFAAGLF